MKKSEEGLIKNLGLNGEQFRAAVIRYRVDGGYTRREAANRVGVSYATYEFWEKGKRLPRNRMVIGRMIDLGLFGVIS